MSIRNDLLEQILAAIGGGGSLTPEQLAAVNSIIALSDGQVPSSLNDILVYSGATVDGVTGEWTFDKAINVPAGSINVGAVVTLSEGGEELVISNNTSDSHGFAISSGFDETGSFLPAYFDLGVQTSNVLQPDDSTTITTSPIAFPIIGGVTPPDIRQTNQATFRSDGATTNVVAEITDDTSGVVIRYIPSKAAFDAVTPTEIAANPGLDFINGDNIVDFISTAPSSPGIFNVGISPFRLVSGQQINVIIKSTAMSLKGNVGGIPFLTQLIQEGPLKELGDMAKATYDVGDIGIVDASQKVADFAVLDENVAQGDMLYIVDAPLTIEGFPTMGIADAGIAGKRPAVAAAIVAGLAAETIGVVQNGFVSGIDTSLFSSNQQLSLGVNGQVTAKVQRFRQEIGVVKDVGVNGSILFKQGDITDLGRLGSTITPGALESNAQFRLTTAVGVERDGVSQPVITVNSPIQVIPIDITNENELLVMTGINLEHTGQWNGIVMTVVTSGGTRVQTIDLGNVLNEIVLDSALLIQPNEAFTITLDATGGSTGGGGSTEMRLDGTLTAQFDAFYVLRVIDEVRDRDLDPDLRTQSRTIAVGYEQQGYQAQIGGGVKETQGWTDGSTGSASFSPQIDPIDGIITLESRDLTSGGLTSMTKPITVDSLQDLFDFGGQLTFLVRSLDGDSSFSAGVGFSDADDPGWKVSGRGRFLVFFGVDGSGVQSFTPEGGTKTITPVINDYIEVIIVIAPGTMVADVYINGVFDQTNDFSVSGSHANYDNTYLCGSGTTSGTNRNANMRTTELTTFTTSATLPFTKEQVESNLVGALPFGVFRDWVIQVPDDDVEFGSSSQTQLSNYGSVTLQRAGINATFNGQDEMTITGPGSFVIAQVNVDPDLPDQRYQVSFQGAAQQTASVFGSSTVALPAFQRLERLALIAVRAENSEDVTLNPDSVTNDTIQLVAQRIQVFLATPIKDGAMSQADKIKLDGLSQDERLTTVRSLDLVLDGTEQVIAFDPAQTSRATGLSVNVGGNIYVGVDGYYGGSISSFIDKSGGSGAAMAIWLEIKPLATGVWELADDQMSNPVVFDDTGLPVIINVSIDALTGDEIRVKIKEISGTATLITKTEVMALGTVNQFAASLSMFRIGPVTP